MVPTFFILTLVVSDLNYGTSNFVNRGGKSFKVPLRPFVISTSLGVSPSEDDSTKGSLIVSSNKTKNKLLIRDRNTGSNQRDKDQFYDFQGDKVKEFVSSISVKENSPKINFYQMNCAVGHKCSAIIPGAKTPMPKPKRRTEEEMRDYLRKHGLENGFNYSKDETVNRKNVVARYFKGEEERRRRARNSREGKKISSFSDLDNYWPGSEYRPGRKDNDSSSKGHSKIYKYKVRRSPVSYPSTGSSFDGDSFGFNDDYTYELPFPTFSQQITETPSRTNPFDRNSKGVWNRFSNSVISQYDKNTNDWVKISSTNTKLGNGFVNEGFKPIHHGDQNDLQTGVGLTVLGIPDGNDAFDSEKTTDQAYKPPLDFTSYGPSPFPTPDRPFPPAKFPSGPNSVSFPLDVLPPELTDPVLVFSSYDQELKNNTYGFPSYTNLTHTKTTTTTTTTTQPPPKVVTTVKRPKPRPRPRPQTNRPRPRPNVNRNPVTRSPNTPSSPNQQPQNTMTGSGGGGGGDEGGGGLIPNPYAIMAAVGAGLIPASIAAILPVILGRRRRRKRSLTEGPWNSWNHSPSHLNLTSTTPPTDPIVKLLQKDFTFS